MGRRNSSLSDEQGKWVLLKWAVSFQQNPCRRKARKMGFVEMVFFPTKPISTKSKENGFIFQQNPFV